MKDTMQRLTTLLHEVLIAADYKVNDSGSGIGAQERWLTFGVMAAEDNDDNLNRLNEVCE